MEANKMKVRVTLIEDMLGTLPADPEIYRDFIASKAPDAMTREEETGVFGEEPVAEKGITVFARDKEGNPFIYDYLIKGFFKNACSAMRDVTGSASSKVKAYKKKIDNLVFVSPRMIKLPIAADDLGICERPLRASTAQGERVALASSEVVPAGTQFEFEVESLTKDMIELVCEWLDYGKYNGLGCWHNSGKGRFSWENITEKDNK